ncbi:hypothetical protein AYX14_02565 [Cryptococcus neoformans]|nr:hypothetical protein AYX15_02595 [Cryptococcus neoformans var. grubii]OWZ72006.1 hypothetical protein AYX14_02565 [Cryptococcus neoformans var. grubii]
MSQPEAQQKEEQKQDQAPPTPHEDEKHPGNNDNQSENNDQPAEDPQPEPQPQQEKSQGGGGDNGPLPDVKEATKPVQDATDTAQGALSGAGDTAQGAVGGVTNGATDQALGPLKSRRKPLPNELADTAPEDQPGGGKDKEEKGSLRINIALDLDVEVHLTARIKGDITIGLL